MKIIWLCNMIHPEIASLFSEKSGNGGGWINTTYERLIGESDVELSYVFLSSNGVEDVERNEQHYRVKSVSSDRKVEDLISRFEIVIKEIRPDVIHIWGTEYIHSYAMTEAAKRTGFQNKVVISIQGLIEMCSYHYMSNIPAAVQTSFTMRDLFKKDTLLHQKKTFQKRGIYERKALLNVEHVIGRTFWDKACISLINPNAKYHFNNESLRKTFYTNRWDITKIQKHSIFVSQSHYPIKGFHNVLTAVNMLSKKYPDIIVYVSGSRNAFIKGFKMQAYGRYIQNLIKEYALEDRVIYLGNLSEQQMLKQYLKSNVFVSPSSIENSPNSVCEAMILGMPVISSNVGGVADLLKHGEEGFLYQADAPYLLAYYLSIFFENEELQLECGNRAHVHAMKTHDTSVNYNTLLNIYHEVRMANED